MRSRRSGREAALLPEHDAVVFDEAHRLEDAASAWFGGRISLAGLRRLARDVAGRAGTRQLPGVSWTTDDRFDVMAAVDRAWASASRRRCRSGARPRAALSAPLARRPGPRAER
jgi:Rad3-related DNA helicase